MKIGHYYDCLTCGEERCRCPGPPSRYDDTYFTDVVRSVKIGMSDKQDLYAMLCRHTHYPDVTQVQLALIEQGVSPTGSLIKSQRCPIDVIITISNRLMTAQFSSGIARINGPLYRKLREPRAVSQVIGFFAKRLGLHLAETTYGLRKSDGSGSINELFFITSTSQYVLHDKLTEFIKLMEQLNKEMKS